MNGLKTLSLKAVLKARGYEQIKEPLDFELGKVRYYSFGNSINFISCLTTQGKRIYIWRFQLKLVVDFFGELNDQCRTNSNAYINKSGFVMPFSKAIDSDEPIIFDSSRIVTLSSKEAVTISGIGDRVLLVGEDGIIYTGYEYPFDKILTRVLNKQAIFPQTSKQVVCKPGQLKTQNMHDIDCIEVFPPFSF